MLCTTTFHMVAEQVQAAVDIPLLHLADVVAEACQAHRLAVGGADRDDVRHVAVVLLRPDRLARARRCTSRTLVHHETINRIIYEELVHGKVLDASRRTIVGLVDELWDAGAGGLILGCTELELLIHQADVELPVFPCTTLHVEAALDRALA